MKKNDVCAIWNDFWDTVAEYQKTKEENLRVGLYGFGSKLSDAMDQHIDTLDEEEPEGTVGFGGDAGSSGGMSL